MNSSANDAVLMSFLLARRSFVQDSLSHELVTSKCKMSTTIASFARYHLQYYAFWLAAHPYHQLMGPATQQLAQQVCQRYGWSAVYDTTNDEGYWYVDVVLGLQDQRRFVSQDTSPKSKKGMKQGSEAAAVVALQGLRHEIERQEMKPGMELTQLFSQEIPVYESTQENWKRFWKHPPTIVGIDTEGNQVSPPLLVQIATEDYTILEVPRHGSLSNSLMKLLEDTSITKVFCDNFSHHDKKSLGLQVPEDLTTGPVLDLEALSNHLMGPAKVARGLSRILMLAMPELDVWIEKPVLGERFANIGKYTLIEQGKAPPLQSMAELSRKEQRYAALDAWCTLYAYRRLMKATTNESTSRN